MCSLNIVYMNTNILLRRDTRVLTAWMMRVHGKREMFSILLRSCECLMWKILIGRVK